MERFPGNCSCNGFCGKVKKCFALPLSDGTYRWKNCRHGFSHSGRCLDKQRFLTGNRMIYTTDDLSLPFSVRKRKLQIFHGCIPFFFPGKRTGNPFMVIIQKFLVPVFKFLHGKNFSKPSGVFCIQMGIGHLDPNLGKAFFFSVNPPVTHCLCAVDRYRYLHCLKISIGAFDLINPELPVLSKNSICAAFYLDDYIFIFTFSFQGNFCLIIALHTSLDLPVKSSTF